MAACLGAAHGRLGGRTAQQLSDPPVASLQNCCCAATSSADIVSLLWDSASPLSSRAPPALGLRRLDGGGEVQLDIALPPGEVVQAQAWSADSATLVLGLRYQLLGFSVSVAAVVAPGAAAAGTAGGPQPDTRLHASRHWVATLRWHAHLHFQCFDVAVAPVAASHHAASGGNTSSLVAVGGADGVLIFMPPPTPDDDSGSDDDAVAAAAASECYPWGAVFAHEPVCCVALGGAGEHGGVLLAAGTLDGRVLLCQCPSVGRTLTPQAREIVTMSDVAELDHHHGAAGGGGGGSGLPGIKRVTALAFRPAEDDPSGCGIGLAAASWAGAVHLLTLQRVSSGHDSAAVTDQAPSSWIGGGGDGGGDGTAWRCAKVQRWALTTPQPCLSHAASVVSEGGGGGGGVFLAWSPNGHLLATADRAQLQVWSVIRGVHHPHLIVRGHEDGCFEPLPGSVKGLVSGGGGDRLGVVVRGFRGSVRRPQLRHDTPEATAAAAAAAARDAGGRRASQLAAAAQAGGAERAGCMLIGYEWPAAGRSARTSRDISTLPSSPGPEPEPEPEIASKHHGAIQVDAGATAARGSLVPPSSNGYASRLRTLSAAENPCGGMGAAVHWLDVHWEAVSGPSWPALCRQLPLPFLPAEVELCAYTVAGAQDDERSAARSQDCQLLLGAAALVVR
jgi:hypothetical protein